MERATSEQGVRVLGTPLGHTDFVSAHLMENLEEHDVLLARFPLIQDLQSAWALLLHCAGGRANYLLRVVRPELVHEFAEGHNTGLLNCLCSIMNIVPGQIHEVVKDIITMDLSIGGMGLRSAHRTSLRERHPEVARTIIDRAGTSEPTSIFGVSCQSCAGFGRGSWVRSPKLGSAVIGRETSPTRTR